MRILITGCTGFAGRHLAVFLKSLKNTELFGLIRPGSDNKNYQGINAYPADILNPDSVRSALRKIKPDRIFHLAGQSSVAISWNKPQETFAVNVEGTRNLLEALWIEKLNTRVHVACSAEQYGISGNRGGKIRESDGFKPVNPYGVSKIAQEYLALQYFFSRNQFVVCTRAFNHIGAGQSAQFAASSFARQFALIEAGKQAPQVEVGNLNAVRDFTDVREAVKAYYLVLEKGKPGETYNVASGRPRKVGEILSFYLGRSSVRIKVVKNKSRMRASDVRSLVGHPGKLKKATGWRVGISFEKTLIDLLDYWKERIVHEEK